MGIAWATITGLFLAAIILSAENRIFSLPEKEKYQTELSGCIRSFKSLTTGVIQAYKCRNDHPQWSTEGKNYG
jgi:hypothetical protein